MLPDMVIKIGQWSVCLVFGTMCLYFVFGMGSSPVSVFWYLVFGMASPPVSVFWYLVWAHLLCQCFGIWYLVWPHLQCQAQELLLASGGSLSYST